MSTDTTSKTIDKRLETLSELSAEDLVTLENDIQAVYDKAEKADDLDGMENHVMALERVYAAREQLAQADDSAADTDAAGDSDSKKPEDDEAAKDTAKQLDVKAEPETPPVEPEAPAAKDEKVENTETAPVVEVTDSTAETEEVKADTDTQAEQESTAMAASGTDFSPPEDSKPVVASAPAHELKVRAGADIPGFSAGSEFHNLDEVSEAMSLRIDTIREAHGGDGQKHVVASVRAKMPDARMLSNDANLSMEKIEKEFGVEAITAAGGYCAPLPVRYEIFGLGSTVRPVRDALPTFGATRGGIRFVTPPKLGDDAGAVGLWTGASPGGADAVAGSTQAITLREKTAGGVATITTGAAHGYVVGQTVRINIDNAAFDGTFKILSTPTATTFTYQTVTGVVASGAASGAAQLVKPLLKVVCAAEDTAVADAVTLQLQFGNLMSRAFPELVARHNQLALIEHARFAERELLAKIAGGTDLQVTSSFALGAARDFLRALSRASSAYRNRHRIDRTTTLRVIAPDWVRDAMREDLASQIPGDDKLAVADAMIDNFIAARNVRVSWHIDAAFAAQANGPLVDYPSTIVWYIFSEGTFLFLDGGTLDLGVVRDSGLVATNDYITFVETFEGIAKVGVEAVQVTTDASIVGSAMGTTDPTGTTANDGDVLDDV